VCYVVYRIITIITTDNRYKLCSSIYNMSLVFVFCVQSREIGEVLIGEE